MPSKKSTKKKTTKKNNVKVTGKKNTTNVQNVTVKIGSGKHGDSGGHRGGGGGGGGAGNKGHGRQQSSAPSTIVIQPPNPTSINPPIFFNPPAPQILGTAQSVASTLGSPAPIVDYSMDDVQSEITTPAESYMTNTTYNSETPSMSNWDNYNKISPMNYMQSTDEATVASKNSFSQSLMENIKHNLHSIPIDDYARAIKSEDADTIKSEDTDSTYQSGNFNWGPYRVAPTTMNNMQSTDEATVASKNSFSPSLMEDINSNIHSIPMETFARAIKKESDTVISDTSDTSDTSFITVPPIKVRYKHEPLFAEETIQPISLFNDLAAVPLTEDSKWIDEDEVSRESTVPSTGPATTGDHNAIQMIWGDTPVPKDQQTWKSLANRKQLEDSYEFLTGNKLIKGHPVHGVKNAALVVVNKLNP